MCEQSESTRAPAEADPRSSHRGKHWASLPFILTGAAALLWFLIRVIPRPSRATYPCQRAAFPIASTFVIWLVGTLGAAFTIRRGRRSWRPSRILGTSACVTAVAMIGLSALIGATDGVDLALPDPPNEPIGEAKGLNPGRVVWVHDPDATSWPGPGSGHWWEADQTDQEAVHQMMTTAIRNLSGEADPAAAWADLIRHFNQTHGFGDVGYTPGEKILIKVNFVGTHWYWGGVDTNTWDLIWQDYPNVSPQVIVALLRHLVGEVGVAQADISVGDFQSLFCNEYFDIISAEFPDIRFLDCYGGDATHPRTLVHDSTIRLHWSNEPGSVLRDYVPLSMAEAKYVINIANLKSHLLAGVTLCGKNHYGSRLRSPDAAGFYNLHEDLPAYSPGEGSYRNLVDMIGHAHMGGKTLLYLVDGLYPGIVGVGSVPIRWTAPPFWGDWTSSLFASQDPIAIDSVCFDFLQTEGHPEQYPLMAGADDYLHEGALAHDPPSGTFYDPDHEGDVLRLASLGVHEHWNNPSDRQYSRNLGTGDGIELIQVTVVTGVETVPVPRPLACTVYPNPFNPQTTIGFELASDARVDVDIYDLRGTRVRSLVHGLHGAGEHTVSWDGRDESGRGLPSGTYFVKLRSGETALSHKISIVR
jgi:hypothetical protein